MTRREAARILVIAQQIARGINLVILAQNIMIAVIVTKMALIIMLTMKKVSGKVFLNLSIVESQRNLEQNVLWN